MSSTRVASALLDLAAEATRYAARRPRQRPTGVTAAETDRARRAVHEAGHSIVATICGSPIHLATLAGGGRTEYVAEATEEFKPAVIFGGPYAEAVWRARTRGTRPDPGLVSMALGANVHDRESLHAIGPNARTTADLIVAPLIKASWQPLMDLAATLFESGQVGPDEVDAVLGSQIARLRRAIPDRYRVALPALAASATPCRCQEHIPTSEKRSQ